MGSGPEVAEVVAALSLGVDLGFGHLMDGASEPPTTL